METAHRIRLPAPWRVQAVSDAGESIAESRHAESRQAESRYERWHLQRSFNRPTGIADDTQLAIEVDTQTCGPLVRVVCQLNSQVLTASSPDNTQFASYSFPLQLLRSVNLLEFDLEFDQPQEFALPHVCVVLR